MIMRAISLLDAHPKMTVANMLHSEKSTGHAHKFAADKAEHGYPSGENRCKWRRRSRITHMLPRLFCWSRREYDGVEAEAGATQARLSGLFSLSFDRDWAFYGKMNHLGRWAGDDHQRNPRGPMKFANHPSRRRSTSVRFGSTAIRRPLTLYPTDPRAARTLQMMRCGVAVALAAGLALAGCTASPSSSSRDLLNFNSASAPDSSLGRRDLTPPEKKIITDAIAPSIRDAASAQYRWAKIPNALEGSVNYCGMVNAKSPYPAYNGLQAYIIEATVTGGKVSSAVVGLIAGGKDIEIVRKMCKKYDLDPGAAG